MFRPAAPQHSPGGEGGLAPCSIFDTTFSLHRVSPLFLGPGKLDVTRLQTLGHRLRDTLVGDFVRGIEVGLGGTGDGAGMGGAGALETAAAELVAADAVLAWPPYPALQITLQYENATCLALLLPPPAPSEAAAAALAAAVAAPGEHFYHLPLLLLRMPAPLKAVIIEFLSCEFDCRIGALRLNSKNLTRAWEEWARTTGPPVSGPLAKDAVLTLGFQLPTSGTGAPVGGGVERAKDKHTTPLEMPDTVSPAPTDAGVGIKTIDVIVASNDLPRMLKVGQGLMADGTASAEPFMNALSKYLQHHLALDMTNPGVSIIRIACGGFVLAESRIKIFGSDKTRHRAAVAHLLGDIVLRARGAT